MPNTDEDIIRLYNKWNSIKSVSVITKTHYDKIREILVRNGVIIPKNGTNWKTQKQK